MREMGEIEEMKKMREIGEREEIKKMREIRSILMKEMGGMKKMVSIGKVRWKR